MIFKLSPTQQKKLDKWKAKIRKEYGEWGSYRYEFTPTGIGDVIKVKSSLTGEKINLTEYDKW